MENEFFDIEEELKKLPAKPGVYLMHDEKDAIIYVGKAVKLKNRVRQYFQSSRNKGAKIEQMVTHIRRFEYIVTDSELEALILECNLIKEHHPKYNTMLMDDKTYPYIKVTVGEAFPRVMFSRTKKKDKSKYFGPYTSAGAVKEILELLRKVYRIRTCNRSLPKDTGKERPCLNYHIHRCLAPCQGYISQEAYRENIDRVVDFLNGNVGEITRSLKEKMEQASENMEFERAMEYRELLKEVRAISQKQKMSQSDGDDRDVIGIAQKDADAVVQVFFVRDGRLIGREHFYMKAAAQDTTDQILRDFLTQFYSGTPYLPRELMLPCDIADAALIEEWLTERRGQKVTIRVPKIGTKEKLVELAGQNARLVLDQDMERIRREEARTVGAVRQLEEILGVEGLERLEAYDISNISGFAGVGSMVVYEQGRPKRSDYRKFRLRTVEGPNDYASMKEVLTRRFVHGMEENKKLREKEMSAEYGSFTKYPDLILMDGGKGQVHIALEVLAELGLQIPVCGMVKDDHHRTRGLYYEDVEYAIDRRSECFHLLTRIQDEAHRFAIEYHRSLRSKGQVRSVLDDIPGIGPARRKALMRAFPSLEEIKAATAEQLAGLEGMNRRAAEQVVSFFHKEESVQKPSGSPQQDLEAVDNNMEKEPEQAPDRSRKSKSDHDMAN